MPKREKAKTSKGDRNTNRPNGKAPKSSKCCHRKVRLSEIEKINLVNGGKFVNVARRWAANA